MAGNDITGTIFAGRYRLERKLGSGGMADVWLAEDQELGRNVAIKILHERYANDAQFVERFRREATHAAGLSHPNIVSIFDRGEAGGSYFIVMEYVEGRTLKELIVTRGPCPVPVAISYVRQVLAALRYAHRNGIIHRDIKPHNVLVDHEGRVKVADFGIARAGLEPDDRGGLDHRHRPVPLARAGARRAGGRELRSLLDRDRPLRAAHRQGAVHRRDAGRDRDEAPLADAPGAVVDPPRDPARPRPRRPPRAREGARRALPLRRRWTATSSSSAGATPSGPETEEAATMVLGRGASTDGGDRVAAPLQPTGGPTAATSAIAPTTRKTAAGATGGRGSSRPARYRARDRRLAPLRQHPRPDRRERAGRGAPLHGHPREQGRRPDHRGRLRAQRAAAAERATSPSGSSTSRTRARGRAWPRAGSSRSSSRAASRR